MSQPAAETLAFQTEARQLLQLMIHSLYSNREIFLRELISNASDAIDKLRFEALSRPELAGVDFEIRITTDKDAGTLTVADNGIGMTRDEVITNLGTIARSGTAEFLKSLTGDQQKDAQLIGQFGVGFYSAFIVADEVEVITRRAGSDEPATRWTSRGEADFTVEVADRQAHGTEVILHLKEDAREFLDDYRLRHIIARYSDHIAVPVKMAKLPLPGAAGDEDKDTASSDAQPEFETVNEAKALWTRSRSEISDDEYKEFYKYISHDFEDPLTWSHNRVEGKLEYTSLLYVPRRAPFDLWNRESPRGLKLYVQRVFIMDEAEQFLPLYLRFVRGVIDCSDLPLNVSREILQKDPRVDSIRGALTKRVLDMLAKLAKDDPEAYQTFWDEFGEVIKEGPSEDHANREAIAGLLRFATTHTDSPKQDQSLADYVARMKDGQEAIYYVASDSFKRAQSSPHLEALRKAGIEALLLYDRIDEWLMTALGEFDGKKLVDAGRGDLDLGKLLGEDASDAADSDETDSGLPGRIKEALGDVVEDVRASKRLTDSPACLVVGENDIGAQMRRVLQSAGQKVPDSKPILEINLAHPLLQRLEAESDEHRFSELAHLIFEQAQLADGGQLEDPGSFVRRLNTLLLELADS